MARYFLNCSFKKVHEKVMASPIDYFIQSYVSNRAQRFNSSVIVEEFNEDLKNIRGKCMDVGCGPGDVTNDLLLPSLGPNAQIIGTDVSENVIKYASETFKDNKRLKFEVLDIETKNLPKKYNSEFDHIFSFQCLHWCGDIRSGLKNIHKMLRPNGTVLLTIIAHHDIFEVFRILTRDIRFAQYIPNKMKTISPYQESENPRKELKKLLQCSGFRVHHCSLREWTYFLKKSNVLINNILSIITFLEDMPQDVMEEFENELIQEYMKKLITYRSFSDNQELILGLSKMLIVYAQKI